MRETDKVIHNHVMQDRRGPENQLLLGIATTAEKVARSITKYYYLPLLFLENNNFTAEQKAAVER